MSLPTIPIQLSGTHQLTVYQVAKAFSDMDADQMTLFFENIAEITDEWNNASVFQWQYLRDEIDKQGNKKALRILQELAEYAK